MEREKAVSGHISRLFNFIEERKTNEVIQRTALLPTRLGWPSGRLTERDLLNLATDRTHTWRIHLEHFGEHI